MNVVGLSCWYHDAAACLVQNGRLVAAAQEERFTRLKHDPSFPEQALESCLQQGGVSPDEVDLVAFYEKPIRKLDRIIETTLSEAPRGFSLFATAVPQWLRHKLWIQNLVTTKLPRVEQVLFPEHHLSHAASAFLPSPFDSAAILTVDGVGEWATTTIGVGSGETIELLGEVRFPHSLGLLYSAATYFLGFRANYDEYKVMGLAPYGRPKYAQLILDRLVEVGTDGSFRLNMKYFTYTHRLGMTGRRFERLFGRPRRRPGTEVTQADADIAASFQEALQQVLLRIAVHLHQRTGETKLCLAGGVALNCVANSVLLKEGPFTDIWVQPAAGDAGGAVGAALAAAYLGGGACRPRDGRDAMAGALLGPCFDRERLSRTLQDAGLPYREYDDSQLVDAVASLLASGRVVGWFQGRMEFGPRALGNRSILADPRPSEIRGRINRLIKRREDFRPFAPSVMAERAGDYFDTDRLSPYMLFVSTVLGSEPEGGVLRTDAAGRVTSPMAAVTHVDGSARLQTVSRTDNHLFWSLLGAFEKKVGVPVLLNTSFNARDEPIVCTPEDAVRCFLDVRLDALALGPFVALHPSATVTEYQSDR